MYLWQAWFKPFWQPPSLRETQYEHAQRAVFTGYQYQCRRPSVEHAITQNVATYGRQLGVVMAALNALGEATKQSQSRKLSSASWNKLKRPKTKDAPNITVPTLRVCPVSAARHTKIPTDVRLGRKHIPYTQPPVYSTPRNFPWCFQSRRPYFEPYSGGTWRFSPFLSNATNTYSPSVTLSSVVSAPIRRCTHA